MAFTTKTSPLHIEDHLQNDEDIKEFLSELANTGTYSDFIHGLATASKTKEAGVTRVSLYKSLSEDGNPRFETVSKVVEALGCNLAIV